MALLLLGQDGAGKVENLLEQGDRWHSVNSSVLLEIELIRVARRTRTPVESARTLLTNIELLEISREVVDGACALTGELKSLDAIHLASALIHAPRLLILDEPLEAVDPVSGQVIRDLLRDYVDGGGTVLLSSHVMELVESICDGVGIMAAGRILVSGTVDQVRGDASLQQKFVELVGQGRMAGEETLQWLRHSSL